MATSVGWKRSPVASSPTTRRTPGGVVPAALDRAGDLDLAVFNMAGANVSLLHGRLLR